MNLVEQQGQATTASAWLVEVIRHVVVGRKLVARVSRSVVFVVLVSGLVMEIESA